MSRVLQSTSFSCNFDCQAKVRPRILRKFVNLRVAHRSKQPILCSAAVATLKTAVPCQAFQKLKGVEVIRSSDGATVELTSLWSKEERALVVFTRSLGCPFCWELAIQLRRDIRPKLDQQGVKLFLVSIGTWERSKEFSKVTGFPQNILFVDPDAVAYKALGLFKGVQQTFFGIETPLALLKRLQEGKTDDLKDVMSRWKPWQPPKPDQALQQGGMFVFHGETCLFEHYDKATGSHADLEEVLGVALQVPADCACN